MARAWPSKRAERRKGKLTSPEELNSLTKITIQSHTSLQHTQSAGTVSTRTSLATLGILALDRLGQAHTRGIGVTPVIEVILVVGTLENLESGPGPEQIGIKDGLD